MSPDVQLSLLASTRFKNLDPTGDYLDIVRGEQSDHRIVFPLVPILVHLSSYEYEIAAAESQFPGRLADEIVERSCHQTRLRCLILGSTSLAQIVHEIVVAIQGYGRLLRRSENCWSVVEEMKRFLSGAADRDCLSVCSEQTPTLFGIVTIIECSRSKCVSEKCGSIPFDILSNLSSGFAINPANTF